MTEEQKLINVQIGKRLQTVRENMGYTQEAFAEVLSVDAGHYQKLERGLYGLSTDKLLTLYERYRIDPTYLITRLLMWNCFLRTATGKKETDSSKECLPTWDN